MHEDTIATHQTKMAAGKLSAAELTAHYLERIEQIDPELNSVIATNPAALATAEARDEERAAHGPRGPLHGIPLLIKDNILTSDMPTTAGSLALAGYVAAADAFVVARLRAAGAIILGKANLSEWANFRSTRSTSGWSSVGGQTRHVQDARRNPCGSSSGSAVAVAAGLCAAAVGTETDGSIICPAQANGIVGLKPTVGLVSRSGIVPVAHSQDTAGPMGRTVSDVAILLGSMAGRDPADAATAAAEGKIEPAYAPFLDEKGLEGARIGVARNFFGFHDRVDAVMEEALATLQRLGAELVDPADVETAAQLGEPEYEVLLYEFKAGLNAFLDSLDPAPPIASLAELIAFNEEHVDAVMPFFAQERLEAAQAKGGLDEEAYREAREKAQRLAGAEGIDATLEAHNVDAIVAPSGGPAWLTDPVTGDHFGGGSSPPAAVAGYPNITVPAGTVFDLPVGLSFFAGAYQEPLLLRLAYAFEQGAEV